MNRRKIAARFLLWLMAVSVTFAACKLGADIETIRAHKEAAQNPSCTVTFNANGGSAVPAQTVAKGGKASAPEGVTRTGHTFGGWYTDNGTFENRWDFDEDTVSGNITLYAKWNVNPLNTHTVTFVSNGGTIVPDQAVITGEKAIEPEGVAFAGHSFNGWYLDNDTFLYRWNFNTPVAGDMILYAKWIAEVTADAETPAITTQPMNFAYVLNDTASPLMVQARVNDGGTLSYQWYRNSENSITGGTPISSATAPSCTPPTNAVGTVYYYAVITNTNSNVNGNKTATAVSSVAAVTVVEEGTAIFTVTFDLNGGTGTTPPAQTAELGSTITLPGGSGFSRSGYTFSGWNTSAAGTGTNYNAGSSYTATGVVTLYAKWNSVPAYKLEMVFVPGGSFDMGKELNPASGYGDVTPVHPVTLSGFSMGKTEVTQAQWQAVMGSLPSDLTTSGYGVGDNYPVYFVNWYDAVEFCNKLSVREGLPPAYTVSGTSVTWNRSATGYRLPTEAEWEYAAKGGNGTPGNYTYSGSNSADEVAWHSGNSTSPQEVGTKKPNDLELYDMNGNVWEWCWDWYGSYQGEEQMDPIGASSGSDRVLRGGDWTYPPPLFRSVVRNQYSPSHRGNSFGFRLVRSSEEAPIPSMHVRFDRNHDDPTGFTEASPQTVTIQPPAATVGSLPAAPTRAGYAFNGWNTVADGGGMPFTATTIVTAPITVYAQWNINRYTVTFNANGGTPAPLAQTLDHGAGVSEPAAITRTGYTFGGWYKESAFTNQWYFTSDTVTGDTTLYAKWNINQYTVTFNANGGTPAPLAQTLDHGAHVAEPAAITRTGYTFGGWFKESAFTSQWYFTSDTVTGGDLTLYARWYSTVTFNANNATGGTAPAAQTANAGSSITLPGAGNLAKTGFGFGSWNTNAAGTGTNYNAGASYTPSGDSTLYVSWVEMELVSVTGVDMVFVPGGSFEMGKNLGTASGWDDNPHMVTLSNGFYMGKYEVTQAQYQAVMGNNPSYFTGENLPVEQVSWYDAVEFCNVLSEIEGLTPYYTINKTEGSDPNNTNGDYDPRWLVTQNTTATGYRLPTEAQWEYAAKGGNPTAAGWVGYTYAGSDDPNEVAWYGDNNDPYGTKPVGTKKPNGLGLYDMSGNVWEWCWDWYGSYSSGAQSDPGGASSGSYRVGRGGLWGYSAENVRSAYRFSYDPYVRNSDIGFRLVRP